MKPKYHLSISVSIFSRRVVPVAALAGLVLTGLQERALAVEYVWSGTIGNFNDTAGWTPAGVPGGNADYATIDNGGTVTIDSDQSFGGGGAGSNFLRVGNAANGSGTVNMTGGSLVIAGSSGETAGPINVGVAAGSTGTLNISGGTINTVTGIDANGHNRGGWLRFGYNGGTANVSISGDSVITVGGSFTLANNAASTSNVTLSGNASLSLTTTGDANGSDQFGRLTVGQFGTSGATGTLTLNDNASASAREVYVGWANADVTGTLNLNGSSTVAAKVIRRGSGTAILNLNGGTVRSLSDSGDFFQGFTATNTANSQINLQDGGLIFDTDGHSVTVLNALSGSGGLTKRGEGTLELSSAGTYTGPTVVEEGELVISTNYFDETSRVEIGENGVLNLAHGLAVPAGVLVLDGVEHTSGVWGGPDSGAANTSPLFAGGGRLLLGETVVEGRDLVWTGNTDRWSNLEADANFVVEGDSEATSFQLGDNVLFDDRGNYDSGVSIHGVVQPGTVTFAGTADFEVLAAGSNGIGGVTGIVKDGSNRIVLGGGGSSFTGPIFVNGGRLVAADHKSFGVSSGISIAAGAQVDVNGRQPGAIYTYTLNGPGPDGEGAIVSSAPAAAASLTGVRFLRLNADSTIGSDFHRFDIGGGGGDIGTDGPLRVLTKIGSADMAVRGPSTNVNFTIRGGRLWAEGSSGAFGNASNVLTVGAGATAGTYGELSIPVGVVLENGASLANIGNGTSTWTGNIAVDGLFTIAAPQPVVLTGDVSGDASMVKTGASTLILQSWPAWWRHTTISEGGIVLHQGGGLSPVGDLVMAAGTFLDLFHGQEDTVRSLLLGGVPATAGVWGSTASGAPNKNDDFFRGTGRLNVLETAEPPLSSFEAWAVSFELEGADARPDADPDADGLENAVEYVLGSDPTQPSTDLLPQLEDAGDDVVFSFQRDDASEDGVTQVVVQSSGDLATWANVPVGAVTGGMVTVEENGSDPDTITVTIPKNGESKQFVRLKVEMP